MRLDPSVARDVPQAPPDILEPRLSVEVVPRLLVDEERKNRSLEGAAAAPEDESRESLLDDRRVLRTPLLVES